MFENEPLKLNFWQPCINGSTISTKDQLREIINIEYSSLLLKQNFAKLMNEAERHIELIEEIKKKDQLERGDITHLAMKFNFSTQKVHKYLKYGTRPRLYWLLDKCCSKTVALQKIANIKSELNGIRTLEDAMDRLDSYYPFKSITLTKSFERRLNHSKKFFEVFQIMKNGGCYHDVARILNVSTHLVQGWLTKRHKPALINLACQIPEKQITSGNKWLPMKLEVGYAFNPTEFISVPLQIESWKQVQEVLDRVKPLQNNQTKIWENQFDKISKAEAFAYTLGLIVSDSRKETRFVSSRLDLSLSKVYDWSEQVGKAFCYYLSRLGIKAKKADDNNPQNHRWQSRMAPLLTWMKQTCLGLQKNQTTSKNPIKATWIFNAPHRIRLKIFQGITDGDGHASVKNQNLGIATSINRDFLQKLLKSFNIDSIYDKKGRSLVVVRNESILQAASLPFFLHAVGRQKNADKIEAMICTRRRQ
jgi:hypothetical protein